MKCSTNLNHQKSLMSHKTLERKVIRKEARMISKQSTEAIRSKQMNQISGDKRKRLNRMRETGIHESLPAVGVVSLGTGEWDLYAPRYVFLATSSSRTFVSFSLAFYFLLDLSSSACHFLLTFHHYFPRKLNFVLFSLASCFWILKFMWFSSSPFYQTTGFVFLSGLRDPLYSIVIFSYFLLFSYYFPVLL